jgi:hypothetical protein
VIAPSTRHAPDPPKTESGVAQGEPNIKKPKN